MTAFIWIIAALVGAVIGSFLNVVIHRGPAMWGLVDDDGAPRGTLLAPRSYCPHCRAAIPAWRLIPVVSYVLQKGRCAACGGAISPRYPLVELGGVAVALLGLAVYGPTLEAGLAALFGWTLLALAVIDWETGYLPDWLTLPLILIGLAANADASFIDIRAALIGAAAGYLVFRLISWAFVSIRGYEGLGQGDAKLVAAIGAWCGWQLLPVVVFIAASTTLLAALAIRFTHKSVDATTPLPFGPGLCLAAYAVLLLSHGRP